MTRVLGAVALGCGLVCAGCVTPSTLLVNDQGHVARCSAHGYGVMGVATAGEIHRRCVVDRQTLGYVPLAAVWLGVHTAPGTDVIARFSPQSQAPAAGLRVGDRLLRVNGRPVLPPPALMRTLAGKQAGEMVEVTIARDMQELVFSVLLQPRGQ